MTEKTQIDEMAKIAAKCQTKWLNNETTKPFPDYIAEALYNVGYRKQSEGRWEKDEVGETLCSQCGVRPLYRKSGTTFATTFYPTMREILFRGKRTDDGAWVVGSLTSYFDGSAAIIVASTSMNTFHPVAPKTVGQYTGLTDKNGKRIFEGDIVKREYTLRRGETKKTRETQIGVVIYSNRECGFQVEKKCNLRKPWDGDTIEVIGNIHDNPELKGGEGDG